MADFKIKGMAQAIRNIRKFAKENPGRVRRALLRWGEETMAVSKELCPVKTGNLRGTGRVEVNEGRMELLYGGTAAPYATIVHETHPTKSKFLQRPMLQRISLIKKYVKEEFEKR